MRTYILLTVLFTSIVNFGHSQIDEVVSEPEELPEFELSENTISINPVEGKYTVKIGQQVYYSARVHASVGYSANANSTNPKALKYSSTYFEYDDEERAEMSGGDAATTYFIFDALEVGTAKVIVRHYFRGDLENEYTIEITVEAKEAEAKVEMSKPRRLKKFKPSKNRVSINPIQGKYTVKVGQQVDYSANIHGSVGYTASAQSSNSEAFPLSGSFIKYDNKRRAKMSGGDSATKHFIFDALETGTYEVTAQRYFRGDLENEYTITITVTE